ncbi:MAG: tyrosine-protein phosphatase [Paraburkholderia tropica]|uniref:Protein-tyrosine phosphatase n=1 Tax=Paraburkholderia tropica TaxID=92647 RepID=A0AAQ1GCL5_9BURK|nr:tyrosine-protein phosphatase [Paraburkholderia tropica]MBB3000216.1 protein-tyrosine phosphatase [Paraburkholderia tropica]MBB6319847.1 protein-tyrosine phosphatase [Paraburkholderia tropica]MDE1144473.1 tyrosine-protein phosphatase [Paraburkholderia tropica]PXX17365.1 protein-tyrosine phosphatase [Paraburkholderia tropica]PZW84546.1 protein-tyrosine phosphatase [Paraburkholderia tropica]
MILRFSASSSSRKEARKGVPAPLSGDFACRRGAGPASPPRRRLLKGTMSVLALSGCGTTLLSACGGDYTGGDGPQDAPTPVMNSVANFRDVGGAAPGYSTSDGAHFRRAILYRSDVLTANTADTATLEGIGLAGIYDLRTPVEADALPDTPLSTASYVSLNVLGTHAPPSFAGMSGPELDSAMQAHWREFVMGHTQCMAYGALLEQIAQAGGPVVVVGGKGVDVAGWAGALLLLIANVPLEIVVKDFLLTNAWRSTGVDEDNLAPPVQASYLQSAFDALQKGFGDLNRYLNAGLGLSSTTVDLLRGRLVV